MNYTQLLVSALSVLTILGQISVVVLAVALLRGSSLRGWVSTHALTLMLITSLTATLGSLYFSDIALWTPCKLCWYQRIFMYPQVVLLAIALWKRDRGIAPYILALSVIGALIAAFHYSEQVLAVLYPAVIDPNVPCDITGESCRSTPFFHFGYITIPTMALTAFVLNSIGSLMILRTKEADGGRGGI